MTHIEVLKNTSKSDLQLMVGDLLTWRKTGLLPKGKFREYVEEWCRALDKHYAFSIAESAIQTEVYRRFVACNCEVSK